MASTQKIPAAQTEAWGFFGTMDQNAEAAWPLAMRAIATATGCSLDAVRAFLDSRFGRHFADEVRSNMHVRHSLEDAIDAATQRWSGMTIGRQTSRTYGIPRGMLYLTGFVVHCAIVDEGELAN